MDTNVIITFSACIILIGILGRLFLVPLKKILKLIINSIVGAFIIYLINYIGLMLDFHIGLNFFTAAFVGILGIPGAILLIIIKLFLGC